MHNWYSHSNVECHIRELQSLNTVLTQLVSSQRAHSRQTRLRLDWAFCKLTSVLGAAYRLWNSQLNQVTVHCMRSVSGWALTSISELT